ncbi:Bacterial regulatory protein, luxR family [Planctomycetes bacterium MalM25]|nr:Bacterial regulatory protein, luxR family [Planctomycetes bacterium MalM25]
MPPDAQHFVRLREARRLYSLVGECLAVGGDGVAWRWRLTKAIRRLLGAELAFFADYKRVGSPESPEGWLRPISLLDDWGGVEHRPTFWEHFVRDRHERLPYSRLAEACETFCVALRSDVIDDRSWYGSAHFIEHSVPMGLDDCLISYSRGPGDTVQSLFLQRAIGAPTFPRSSAELVRGLWGELRQFQPVQLSSVEGSAFMDLPKRMLQVLACLLTGYTAKETAELIGVSTHTVQEHVRRLYKRSKTTNRAELAARYRTIAPVLVNTSLEQLPDVSELINKATQPPWPHEPGRRTLDPP